jgi:hypothetical protein
VAKREFLYPKIACGFLFFNFTHPRKRDCTLFSFLCGACRKKKAIFTLVWWCNLCDDAIAVNYGAIYDILNPKVA